MWLAWCPNAIHVVLPAVQHMSTILLPLQERKVELFSLLLRPLALTIGPLGPPRWAVISWEF